MAHITTPHLKVLQVACTNITAQSAPAIAKFVSSPRCRLHSLSMSDNSLQEEGLDAIVSAMQCNFSLISVGIFANVDGDYDYQKKRRIEARNRALQQDVTREALILLRMARILLLGSRASGDTDVHNHSASLSFTTLPLELKQYILTFFAPHLSTAQSLRIIKFASTPSTLPSYNTDTTISCLPDPSAMPSGSTDGYRRSCEGGACMGSSNSVLCQREDVRKDWLLKVGCDAPESTGALTN